MGDVQSSQAAPALEQNAKTTSQEAPWNPDNITDSSDEESVAAMKEVHTPIKPNPPPDPAHTPLQQTSNEPTSQTSAQSSKSQKGGIRSGKYAAIGTDNVNAASDSLRTSTKKVKRNKFELRQSETTTPPIASVSEHDHSDNIQLATEEKRAPRQTSNETDIAPSTLDPINSRYPCPFANTYDCSRTFASKKSAMRHAGLHNGPQKFPCSVCTKAYSRADSLNAHLRSHSKQEVENARTSSKGEQQLEGEVVEETEQDNEDGLSVSESLEVLAEIPEETTSEESITASKADAQPVTKASATFPATSDQPADTEVVEETPRPKSRLKRKRDMLQNNLPTSVSNTMSSKRRRKHSLSPPTSIASSDSQSTANGDTIGSGKEHDILTTNAQSPKESHPQPLKNRLSNNVSKPSAPDSQSHKPIPKPHSSKAKPVQRVQVIIPQSSQAQSSTQTKERQKLLSIRSSDDLADDGRNIAKKSQQTGSISPKGKQRAASGVNDSSPPRHVDNSDEDEGFEPEGMATSIAKRGRSEGAVRGKSKQIGKSDKSTRPAAKGDKMSASNDDDQEAFVCPECKLEFNTEAKLRKHSRGHQEANDGDDAGENGRKGAFKPWEVKKLVNWRDNFCQDNAIEVPTFNQMMTDSCRRGKDLVWPYRSITKSDFLQEYYDLLPGRNRRSMSRYRERQFQNVPVTQEWTQDDDEELMQLVKEVGQKWVEIGQRMTRTQDSVSQRWRFKVQYKNVMNFGEWTPSEEESLKDAIAHIKKELRLPLDPFADVQMPWESVSRRLDGSRSAQQCSNKWRLMHLVRKGNKFIKPNSIDRMLGTPKAVATPSKMTQRLSGTTSSRRRKYTSAQRVQTSDEESSSDANLTEDESDEENKSDASTTEDELNAGGTQDASDVEDDVPSQASSTQGPSPSKHSNRPAMSRKSQSEGWVEVETPIAKRNPLATRTPGTKSLSQAFAQTQANTSALRAPTTTRKAHTQSDMPTPGIPIQKRPTSSSWLTANKGDPQDAREVEDAIMAEPESSDDGMRSIQLGPQGVGDKDTSEVSSSASDTGDDENSEVHSEDEKEAGAEAETEAKSGSASSSSCGSSSSGSTAEECEDDSTVHDSQKNSFIQSLRTPNNRSSFSSRAPASSGPRRSQSKIDWENVLRGKGPIQDDSDSDSEDEGDIMHH